MWFPERQRREARPTAGLIALAAIFLVPMVGSGIVGVSKLAAALSPIVSVASPGELDALPSGTYVAVDVEPPPPPIACAFGAPVTELAVTRVEGAALVIVASRAPIAASGAHVVGQLCDVSSPFSCDIPDPEIRRGLRGNMRYPGAPSLVLVSGSVPSDMMWEAAVGLGLSAAFLLTFVFAAVSLLRATREPGRVALERTLMLTKSPEELRATLRATAGPLRRIAEDSSDRLCVLLGAPVARVLVMGFHTADSIPVRVDIEFNAVDPYRGTIAKLTIRELLPSLVSGAIAVDRATDWALSKLA